MAKVIGALAQQSMHASEFQSSHRKIKGTKNPADIFTKHLPSGAALDDLMKVFGCEVQL